MDFSEIPSGDVSEDDGYENDSDLDSLQDIGENFKKIHIRHIGFVILNLQNLTSYS